MTNDDISKIINKDDFSWIKVKRFVEPENIPDANDYARLVEHHKKETEFLIGVCRTLAMYVSNEGINLYG